MSYFQGNIGSTPGMGFTDEVNSVLMHNFSDSPYSGGGLVTASNLEWLKSQEFPFIGYGGMGWGGTYAYLSAPVDSEHTPLLGLLVEVLNGLSDYPLVDDELYSEMETKLVEEYLAEIAEEYSLDPELLTEFHWEGLSNQVVIESDLSPYLAGVEEFVSDFNNWDRERLARLNGAVTLDI